MEGEALRFIREEIKRQLNIVLNGVAGSNTSQTETIDNLFPGMNSIDSKPVMHPYGFVSRATAGTTSVAARIGDHFGARMVLGHRDAERPEIENGETMLYNSTGEQIYVKHGDIIFTGPKVHIGSSQATEPFVLGLVFQKFAHDILTLIEQHVHVTRAPGAVTSEPTNFADFLALKQDPIDNARVLSDKIFGEKG
jgi:hypothetical protein